MFNFTGQSRRRNVNLGNKSGTTKQDLLLKAQQERQRRAKDRQNEAACKVIQCYIRRHLLIKDVIKDFTASMNHEQVFHLILVFGGRLVDHLEHRSLAEILHDSKDILRNYPGYLGNRKLCSMISRYVDDFLIERTIECLNISFPVEQDYVNSLISFIRNTRTLSYNSTSHICEVLLKWGLNQSNYLNPLFEIRSEEAKEPSTLYGFYQAINSYDILPSTSSHSSVILENLAYIYSHTTQKQPVEICLAACFKNLVYSPQNSEMQYYVTQLYEKRFVDRLANLLEQGNVPDVTIESLISFINCAPTETLRDSVMITLLSRPSFLKKLYSDVSQTAFDRNDFQSSASFSIFVRLLEMYLLVSTDHELLSESSGFTVNDLVAFTTRLKNFVFNNLWNLTAESRPKILDDTLPLLRKIYLRDSRLHFCRQRKEVDYWSSDNSDFLQVSAFKYIEDYEGLYREYADRRDDTYNDHEDQDATYEASSIKFRILTQLMSTYRSSVSTRQFKKLEILIKAPFFIPFEQRVDLFYMFIALDKQRLHLDDNSAMMSMLMPWGANSGIGRQSATISRENMLEDACNAFNSIGERFKAKLAVTFVNEFGPEAGIDGGGITKEFLTSVAEEGFSNTRHELFQTNDQHELYPTTAVNSQKLRYLWFLGKILGKCLYDHVLIDVTFADFFLKKMLNPSSRFTSSFDDLHSLDAILYSNLVKLLSMNAEQLEELDLLFEINSPNGTGSVVELIPNGSKVKVRKDNVLLYIIKVADFKLNKTLYRQTQNFHGGMSMIIAPHWMEMFNSVELQMLISGGGKDIDLVDLKNNTEYGGFLEKDKTINDFWTILQEFKPEERLNFIKFVTSVPRAPLQGFQSLEPKFGIRNAGRDLERLPTASTCVNLLKLPDYQDKELLRDKLLYSINSGARFDLS